MTASAIKRVLLLSFVIAHLDLGATTCIANKAFKVRRICGTVADPAGALIPNAQIELLSNTSSVLQNVQTDSAGRFVVTNVSAGNYVIRVKYPGFAAAWQPFSLSKPSHNAECRKPMQVRLELAGRCSVVSTGKSGHSLR